MKKIIKASALAFLLIFAVFASNCIVVEREVDVVITDEQCLTFPENHDSENYTTPDTLFLGDELNQVLIDNEVSRSDIVTAHLVSASYQVRDTILAHDWKISGEILIKRIDVAGPEEVLIAYDTVSVNGAMPAPIGAELEPLGVDIIDQAFEDFIAGANPILVFTVVSGTGDIDPDPSPGDPMVFTWYACVTVQVVATIDLENIPDPW
jgi:hypothetical protein